MKHFNPFFACFLFLMSGAKVQVQHEGLIKLIYCYKAYAQESQLMVSISLDLDKGRQNSRGGVVSAWFACGYIGILG